MINVRKGIGRYIVISALLIIIYIIALTVAHSIPTKYIENNIAKSYELLEKEGLYFTLTGSWIGTYDNYTDALYLNTMLYADTEQPFLSMIRNMYAKGEGDGDDPIKWLNSLLNCKGGIDVEYSRYWIGSISYLRPMLILFDLGQIRQILFTIIMTLMVYVSIMIYRVGKKMSEVYAFTMPCVMMYLPVQSMGLAYFTDIFLFLIGMVAVIKLNERGSIYRLFFIMGSLAFYLNYFSYPFIILGMPLTYLVNKMIRENKSRKACIWHIFCISLNWSLGFGLTMLLKQGLAYVFLGNESGISQALFRIGVGISWKERLGIIFGSICYWIKPIYILILLIVLIYWWTEFRKMDKNEVMCRLQRSAPLGIMFLFPFIWEFFVAQHSIHFFVSNVFIIAIYAGMLFLDNIVTSESKLSR